MAQNVVRDRTAGRFLGWGVMFLLSRARQLGVKLWLGWSSSCRCRPSWLCSGPGDCLNLQPPTICRIVVERGRRKQRMPKGLKETGFEQGKTSVIFLWSGSCFLVALWARVYVCLACIYNMRLMARSTTTDQTRSNWRARLLSGPETIYEGNEIILRGQYTERRDGRSLGSREQRLGRVSLYQAQERM